jgi:hypothetical protein
MERRASSPAATAVHSLQRRKGRFDSDLADTQCENLKTQRAPRKAAEDAKKALGLFFVNFAKPRTAVKSSFTTLISFCANYFRYTPAGTKEATACYRVEVFWRVLVLARLQD